MRAGTFYPIASLFVIIAGVSCTKYDGSQFMDPPKPMVKKTFQWGKEGSLLKVSSSIINHSRTDELDWTTYEYDKSLNLIKTTDSAQEITTDGYIIEGHPAEKRIERVYEYNNNMLVKVTYADSLYPVTNINYNAQGLLVTAINSSKKFSFEYSNNGETVNDTIVFSNGIHLLTILNKYFLQNENLVKSQQFDLTGGSSRQTTNVEYTYDQKNTPLNMVPQANIGRLFFTNDCQQL